MAKKGLTTILSSFLFVFYVVIVMYVFYGFLHIDVSENFEFAIVFEVIGFLLLAYFLLSNIILKPVKIGCFVPLITVTVIYTVLLDIINLVLIVSMPHVFFILTNLILIFIYCMISIPMYIMGRK